MREFATPRGRLRRLKMPGTPSTRLLNLSRFNLRLPKPRILNLLLAAGVIGIGGAGWLSLGSSTQNQARIASVPVQRGTVLSTVTASGNVTSAQDLSLNFVTGGILTQVLVQPGQRVAQGQLLARIDDRVARDNVASARASLNSAAGRLTQLRQGLSPQERNQNYVSAVQAQDAVNAAQNALYNTQLTAANNTIIYQRAINQAISQRDRDAQTAAAALAKLQADQQAAGSSSGASPNPSPSVSQATLQQDQQAFDQANAKVAQDNDLIANAQDSQRTGLIKDKQSVDAASAQLNSAKLSQQAALAANAVKAQPPRVGDMAVAQAAVTAAQTALDQAQKTLDDTSLKAPASGTVASVSAGVGESSDGGGGGAGGAAGGTGAAGGFIVLTNLDTLEIKAGFSEADAAKLRIDQPASVTFDALSGQASAGKLRSIDTVSTVVNNVVTYNATVSLNEANPAVKPGMTASVSIAVAQKDNVLRVPRAAVTSQGDVSTVRVVRGTAVQRRVVVTGLRGDDTVEIVSGLAEGERVATGRPSVTPGNNVPGGEGGGGPLGGGGEGGGPLGGGGGGGGGD